MSVIISGCSPQAGTKEYKYVDRESKIPSTAVKITAATDKYPPKLNSTAYQQPVALEYPVNTAGYEDSPFISGSNLYFFFTPAKDLPENQVRDEVSGIYTTENQQGKWSVPERVHLQDPGKLALDGCAFIQDQTMWFCSSREGYQDINWFTPQTVYCIYY